MKQIRGRGVAISIHATGLLCLLIGVAACSGNAPGPASAAPPASLETTGVSPPVPTVTQTVTAIAPRTAPSPEPAIPTLHIPPPPVCPSGNVQVQLTTAKIGPPVGTSGPEYQYRSVDLKETVTNRTDANIELDSSSGPPIWGDPYSIGKNVLKFFPVGPPGAPILTILKPGQSFVYSYMEPAYITNTFIWRGVSSLRMER